MTSDLNRFDTKVSLENKSVSKGDLEKIVKLMLNSCFKQHFNNSFWREKRPKSTIWKKLFFSFWRELRPKSTFWNSIQKKFLQLFVKKLILSVFRAKMTKVNFDFQNFPQEMETLRFHIRRSNYSNFPKDNFLSFFKIQVEKWYSPSLKEKVTI